MPNLNIPPYSSDFYLVNPGLAATKPFNTPIMRPRLPCSAYLFSNITHIPFHFSPFLSDLLSF